MAILAVLGVLDIFGETAPSLTITTVALGMAMIATGVLGTPFVNNWLTGNTGALLTSTAGLINSGGRWRRMPHAVKSALAITVGIVLGAASYALFLSNSQYALLIGLLPTFIVALLALDSHRRRRSPMQERRASGGTGRPRRDPDHLQHHPGRDRRSPTANLER